MADNAVDLNFNYDMDSYFHQQKMYNQMLFNAVIKEAQKGSMVSGWLHYLISEWFDFYRHI